MATPNKFTPQSYRQPSTPNSQQPQVRQASIAELLSTPPQLDQGLVESLAEPSNSIDLSRNASVSSHSSLNTTSTTQTKESTTRNLQDVKLSELIESAKLIFIKDNISTEDAYHVLQSHNLTSLPVEQFEGDVNCLTFDYTDLNAFLMLVLGKLQISEQSFSQSPYYRSHPEEVTELIHNAKKGESVPVKFAIQLAPKNPFFKLPETETLSTVVELLGSGVHRIAIVNEQGTKITGILSQRRLIKYLWDNARRFPVLEGILDSTIDALQIGNNTVISVFGDEPLINALQKMNQEKISSIAVVDHHMNLLGNISVTDVKHVTNSSNFNLLHDTCLHFVSIILNLRGIEDGKDSFPIFHVNSSTSLSRTVAKLVATKSHRLWIVSPHSSSASSTPTSSASGSTGPKEHSLNPEPEGRAGKLIGVISLTDILGLIARKNGKLYVDPNQARKQRRRSSSNSTTSSLDQFRRSVSGASDLR